MVTSRSVSGSRTRGAAVLGLALAAVLPARAADAPVPLESFLRIPAISEVRMSPSGKHLALVIAGPNESTALAIADVDKPGQYKGVAKLDRGSIVGIAWVNDNRVAFRTLDFQLGLAEQSWSGLLAVNRDGSNFRRLISSRYITEAGAMARDPLSFNHRLHSVLRDGSDDVIVEQYDFEPTRDLSSSDGGHVQTELLRLNTANNSWKRLLKNEVDRAAEWLVDGQGQPRLVVTYERDRRKLLWREGDGESWRLLSEQDALQMRAGDYDPVAVGADGKLYVRAAAGKADGTSALRRLDLASGKADGETLLALDGFDFEGNLVWDHAQRRLVGVRYLADAPGTAWLDPALREMQAQVDKLLPNTNNAIDCGAMCLGARRVLVVAASDIQPALFFVFDRDSGKLDFVGASRPWIDPRRMAQRDFVRVPARDGRAIPVHVTRPQGKGPFPAVVLIHGGPYVPGDSWRWEGDGQLLASRGYLVIEPDYRGTLRYGFDHFKAGWKQWGLAMQDDITDATQWAVKQGLADPKRLVIAGASYGGYATMMGLVREPELYRAGINWVGVTDIELMYEHPWSDLGDFGRRYYLPRLVGDPVKDKAQLDATSPLKQAARIKRPVLMAYGKWDERVPVTHGSLMRDALARQGVPVEWVEYAEEGHGFLKLDNQIDFWRRVERFLAEHTK